MRLCNKDSASISRLVFAAFQDKARQANILYIYINTLCTHIRVLKRKNEIKQSKTRLWNFYYVKLQIRCDITRIVAITAMEKK